MQQVLTIAGWDDAARTAELRFAYNKRFHIYLKAGLKPLSYRHWDSVKKRWRVHAAKLPEVVLVASRWFQHVDYSELPGPVQVTIAAAKNKREVVVVPKDTASAHEVLFILPDAPREVIDAAYKALARMHHPDQGGDEEKMQRINRAYEELKDQS